MLCSRTSNKMINKIHERALRAVLNDYTSDFKTLLQRSNGSCIHHKNNQTLLIEIFKTKKWSCCSHNGIDHLLSQKFPWEISQSFHNFFRNFSEFEKERNKALYFELETFSYRSLQLLSCCQNTRDKLTS